MSEKLIKRMYSITESHEKLLTEERKKTTKSRSLIVREALDSHFANKKYDNL
jgi:DNA-binding PadR family transcriptional regulator